MPVTGASARNGKEIDELKRRTSENLDKAVTCGTTEYPTPAEEGIAGLEKPLGALLKDKIGTRLVSLRLIENDKEAVAAIEKVHGISIADNNEINLILKDFFKDSERWGHDGERLSDKLTKSISCKAN